MFGRGDKEETLEDIRRHKETQGDIDEIIENKIKACQQENGRCMGATSKRLREKYGYFEVTTVIKRLNKRKQRGNKYQEKGTNEILNLITQLTKTNDRTTTQNNVL